jgi:stage II sporulation protein D
VPSWGGRVSRIRVRGTGGTVTVTGAQFRTAFGLKSTKFHVTP